MHILTRYAWANLIAALCAMTAANAQTLRTDAQVAAIHNDNGDLWFDTNDNSIGFRIDQDSPIDLVALLPLLNRSSKDGLSLGIVFDPNSSMIDPQGWISYRVCSAELDGKRVGKIENVCPNVQPSSPKEMTARASMAWGIAYAIAGVHLERAVDLLGTALEASWKPQTLWSIRSQRGWTEAALSYREPKASLLGDLWLIAAARDQRALVRRFPEEINPRFNLASTLSSLGDYNGALEQLDEIARRKAGSPVYRAMSRAIVLRLMNEPERALAALDAVDGDNDDGGMMYQYHRGRALLDLNRNADAAAAFTSGMQYQADYLWAYAFRSCAYGRLGKLDLARDDVKRAIALTGVWPVGLRTSVAGQRWRAVMKDAAKSLVQATTATQAGCPVEYFESDAPRQRSSLLPPVEADAGE